VNDLNPARTVGELRALMAALPDDMPVKVHLGWDLPIVETGIDEDGFIMFAADDTVAAVSREWYEKQIERWLK
jgi:hypothetical protein